MTSTGTEADTQDRHYQLAETKFCFPEMAPNRALRGSLSARPTQLRMSVTAGDLPRQPTPNDKESLPPIYTLFRG